MKKYTYVLLVLILTFLVSCGKKARLEYSGTIEVNQIDISSQASGEIINIYKKEGDRVEKNDKLLLIEHDILNLKLDRAKLALRANREKYLTSKKSYETAKQNYKRIKSLYKKDSVSKSRLDEIENKFVSARSKFQIADANLNKIKKEIEILKKQIGNCSVESPVEGTITEKIYEKGELATKGAILYTISDLKNLKVYIYVPEKDLRKLKIGKKVKVYSDTYPDRGFVGKIYHIAEEAEFTPKNVQTKEDRMKQVFKVKIRVENKNEILKPGMPCDVVISLNK